MADKKITQLNNITGANLAEADEFVVVDITADETKAITFSELKTAFDTSTGFVRITGDTMTGNLSFGTNDKAIFGNGSDLQIYHNGSHSYIDDVTGSGTGSLYIKADQFYLNNTNYNYLQTNSSGDIRFKYQNATKLATTSTGIDVTGTVTADGINSSGDFVFTAADGMKISAKESVVINIDSDDNDSNRSFSIASGSPTSLEYLITATEDSGVHLYYNNASKLATTSTGIDVTGNATFSNTLEVNNYRYFDGDYNVTYYRKANHTLLGYQLHRDNDKSFYEWNNGGTHSHDFQFVSNNSAVLNLATNGNVNIPNGSLMVGSTVSPNTTLHLSGLTGSPPKLTLEEGGAESRIYVTKNSPTNSDLRFQTEISGTIADRMVIDYSGNVKINNGTLQIERSGSSPLLQFTDTGVNSRWMGLVDGTSNFTIYGTNGSTQELTLDSSGNLLVGKTALGISNAGHTLAADGYTEFTRTATSTSSGSALNVGRNTHDGSLATFWKDGSTVGSIGVASEYLYIHGTRSTDAGLMLGSQVIAPASSTGANRNNAIDLGFSGNAFRDLFLSGGVDFGGAVNSGGVTSSSNKLSDYEEGTWTPTDTFQNSTNESNSVLNASSGSYTKIGNVVHFTAYLNIDVPSSLATDNYQISGLPFACANVSNQNYIVTPVISHVSTDTSLVFFIQPNQSVMFLSNIKGDGNGGVLLSSGNGRTIRISGTYKTG